MTINQAYKEAIKLLSMDFIENPGLEARILICHILKIELEKFILIKDHQNLSENNYKKISGLINKRLSKLNIAYIIKKKSFYDLDFYINKNVLIPRPETELIIDLIIKKFDKNQKLDILDIGCGSGNIAITLAFHFPNSTIDALDKSNSALKVTGINATKNNIPDKRIKLLKKDIFKYIPKKKYDIIVSNPPYIKTVDVNTLKNNKIIFDPSIALDGGNDGLKFYKILDKICSKNLKNNGWALIEHGKGQRKKILDLFKNNNYSIEIYDDLSKIDRVIAINFKGLN